MLPRYHLTVYCLHLQLAWFTELGLRDNWDPRTVAIWTFSNLLWLNCALILVGIFFYDAIQARKVENEQQRCHAVFAGDEE